MEGIQEPEGQATDQTLKSLRKNCSMNSNFDFATSNLKFATGKFDLDNPAPLNICLISHISVHSLCKLI